MSEFTDMITTGTDEGLEKLFDYYGFFTSLTAKAEEEHAIKNGVYMYIKKKQIVYLSSALPHFCCAEIAGCCLLGLLQCCCVSMN